MVRFPSRAAAVVAALCLPLGAQATAAPPAAAAPPFAAAVRALLEQQRQREDLPGLSAAIAHGEQCWADGTGFADLENDVPATAATVYRLASISKPITAVCALRLAEQGRLDLDRDVHTLVPEWPAKPWPVTTRQLLAHLGGVRHYRPGEAESTVRYATQTAALARFANDPLLHEPGTRYHYSTYGYNLVAAVVEAVAGKPFPAVVQELVAAPSGAASLQDDDLRRLIRHRAQGYVRAAGALQNSALMDGSYKLGGGGLCSNAPDLCRFGLALCDDRLLQPATRAAMWTVPSLPGGQRTSYALGFGVRRREGRLVVAHSGAQARVSTLLHLEPEDRLVVALLCNLERVALQQLAERIAAAVRAAGGGR